MKNVIFKLLWVAFFVGHGIKGYTQQEIPRTYLEFNGGLAILNDNWSGVFPGLSCLIGQQRFSNKLIFEYQAGLSLPSIVTAKLGVGATGKVLEEVWEYVCFPILFSDKSTLDFEMVN